MAKYKDTVSEATGELGSSVREVNRVIAESTMTAAERNVKFAQGSFEHEVELLRGHAKSTRALTDKLVGESEKVEPLFEFVTQSVVAAGDRNVKFVQRFLEDGTELLESHVEGARTLMQTLSEQSGKQREALGVLVRGTWDAYRSLFPSPLSSYERVIETAESIARRGADAAESIARRGADAAEKMANHEKQAAHTAKK